MMKGVTARSLSLVGTLGLILMGCGGPGQTVPLSVNMDAVSISEKVAAPLRVTVVPFQDVRANTSRIGRYQHYSDATVDTLVPAGGTAADQITNFIAEYLKRAGFQVSRARAGEAITPGSADVVISGQIELYWNEAVTRFGRTKLATLNRLVFRVANMDDGSKVRTTVDGRGTTTVVFFDLTDLEQLDGEALGQTLTRFLTDVVVVNRTLKAKN
jgi:hypothetical protein